MALYTLLLKLDETDRVVRYRFGPDEDHLGVLELDKQAQEIREVHPPAGGRPGLDLRNARHALFRILAAGSPFPDATAYEA